MAMGATLSIDSLEIYEELIKDFGEEKAKALSRVFKKIYIGNDEIFHENINKVFELEKKELATKEDISAIKIQMAQDKSEIIKWMFLFIVGQMSLLIAILKFLN